MKLGICQGCNTLQPVRYSQLNNGYVVEQHQHEDNDCGGCNFAPKFNSIQAQRSTILPEWASAAIASIAYENGHASGYDEVANIEEGMIAEFESAMREYEARDRDTTRAFREAKEGWKQH